MEEQLAPFLYQASNPQAPAMEKYQDEPNPVLNTYKHAAEILGRSGSEDVADVARAQHLEIQIFMDA